ncbi:hypothetical protein NDI39_10980 [Microcoleus sp. ZQ-A2]
MYISPTPYGLISGADRQITLILPEDYPPHAQLEAVGQLTRIEADRLVIGYSFNMMNNELTPEFRDNPSAGKINAFVAYRAKGINGPKVSMKNS